MFSSALKSFSSSISSNYAIAPQPSSAAGPWKIFDAKRKQTGKPVSVFVFDKKSLEPQNSGLSGRSSTTSLKRAHDEVLERLKKEASSLARLRHPSILELAEPVEETRSGGLMFATEPVTCSLAQLLHDKDDQEHSGGRASRYVVEESDGTRRRRELEVDELEIQKGLLQLGKGLEFLHESAGLVHANLTPEAVLVNAKGDWKISGLSFCGPHESCTSATSFQPISLHEVLTYDPRLPKTVQLDLDFTSPDFVLDSQLTASADLFSLGLVIIALYNSPHVSPISVGGSLSTYRRVFSSSSTIPTQTNNFLVPRANPLPPKMAAELLPRLITRRPAQRLSAKEFQQASYFDNILVSTIRFLDELPAKTPVEKMQFMRGLPRIMPQFPKSVLEKKVLPALLEEMKDKDLLAPIMSNIFTMLKVVPTGKRAFTERVVPKLRDVFMANRPDDKDTSREAGLMILLENMGAAVDNCSGKEFREDLLPIILHALESPTHAIVEVALGTLACVLPALDFTTVKNDLFPVVAALFAKTNSLRLKVRGLDSFYILCGGSSNLDADGENGFASIGINETRTRAPANSCVLDRYTIQEKVVPLIKGIKTKEPGVMMAALRVFRQVAEVADSDFLAMEVLPILWSMSLGPLLNLPQFQAFMSLIQEMGSKIEKEHTRKLKELSSANGASRIGRANGVGSALASGASFANGEDADFESLVSGRQPMANGMDLMNGFESSTGISSNSSTRSTEAPTFSWQSQQAPPPSRQQHTPSALPLHAAQTTRTITPDLSFLNALTPQHPQQLSSSTARGNSSNTAFQTIKPISTASSAGGASIDWSSAWSSAQNNAGHGSVPVSGGSTSIPPTLTSPPAYGPTIHNLQRQAPPPQQQQVPKTGLDKYESLL